MKIHYFNSSQQSAIPQKGILSDKCHNISRVAVGIIICLGGIFLLLSANQILPQGPNIVSALSEINTVLGGVCFAVGLIYLDRLKRMSNSGSGDLQLKSGPVIPAKPGKFNPLPSTMQIYVCQYLNVNELCVAGRLNTVWQATFETEIVMQRVCRQKLIPDLAQMLYARKKSWRQVFHDLYSPIKVESDELGKAKLYKKVEYHEQGEQVHLVYEIIDSPNAENAQVLRDALQALPKEQRDLVLNTNFRDSYRGPKCSFLTLAAVRGHFEYVKLLVEFGAKDRGVTQNALFYAVGYGHLRIVRFLLENGARPDLHDEFQKFNILNGDKDGGYILDALNPCLKKKLKNIGPEYFEGLLLLLNSWKARVGEKFLKLEWIKGAVYINLPDKPSIPVNLNEIERSPEILNLFLAVGVKPELSEASILDCVFGAFMCKDLRSIQIFDLYRFFDFVNYRNAQGQTILPLCEAQGAKEITQYLIARGVPTNVLDNEGLDYKAAADAALLNFHWNKVYRYITAESQDKLRDFEQCVSQVADLNLFDAKGETLLHHAVQSTFNVFNYRKPDEKLYNAIKILLDHGADPHLPSHNGGKTPYQTALEVFNADILNMKKRNPILYRNAESLITRMKLMKKS